MFRSLCPVFVKNKEDRSLLHTPGPFLDDVNIYIFWLNLVFSVIQILEVKSYGRKCNCGVKCDNRIKKHIILKSGFTLLHFKDNVVLILVSGCKRKWTVIRFTSRTRKRKLSVFLGLFMFPPFFYRTTERSMIYCSCLQYPTWHKGILVHNFGIGRPEVWHLYKPHYTRPTQGWV